MSDNVLLVFLLGLFVGGFIATLAVALVASGSAQRWRKLFPRVDLRPEQHGLDHAAELSVVRADDIEKVPDTGGT